jgi:sortase B
MGKKKAFWIAVITTACAALFAFQSIPFLSDLIAFRRRTLPDISPFDAHWNELNSDFAGWLRIDGTNIDFPVVRGSNNTEYLNTTFSGEENMLGAIFMDYRSVEDSPHIIIYGHQLGDISGNTVLFGTLINFLDTEYLTARPYILFLENGELHQFEIFSARATDIYDPAYQINFNTPDSFETFLEKIGAPTAETQNIAHIDIGALQIETPKVPVRIITLSTCIGADNDNRMIVQGILRQTTPVTFENRDGRGWRIVRP